VRIIGELPPTARLLMRDLLALALLWAFLVVLVVRLHG
jgi:hypothetical protein